jgi:hypothetical protein
VVRSEVDRGAQVGLPLVDGLSRHGEDQVEIEVVEARGARAADRSDGIGGAVDAPERFQVIVAKRLDAEADAVDAGRAQTAQLVAVDGPRIRLERDLGAVRQRPQVARGGEQIGDGRRREERGRPAAEEDRLDGAPRPFRARRRGAQLGDQGVGVGALRPALRRVRVEVAVGTLRIAVGDVQVQRERGHGAIMRARPAVGNGASLARRSGRRGEFHRSVIRS